MKSCFFLSQKGNQTPKMDAKYAKDNQDTSQRIDPPDYQDPWEARYAQNAQDVKAVGDAGDP